MKSFIDHIKTQYLQRITHDFDILMHGVEDPKVNFLICGTQKGGTTALDEYLRRHPEICMASHKEVHFFDREKYFIYHRQGYREYHDYFQAEPGYVVLGENTPVYMYWYSAPRRIWEYNPAMKLIIPLRNPIERAYSHWNMQRERGYDQLSFFDAINEEENRRKKPLTFQNRRFSYPDRGFYSEQIKRLRAYFPMEQILLLRSETLRDDPESVLNRIFQFIAVSNLEQIEKISIHSRNYADSMDHEARNRLTGIYDLEIKQIEKLTGWDCQNWMSP